MKIWKMMPSVAELNQMGQNTIHKSLGIQFTEIGDDYLQASMPVDPRTHQPMGLLHGGASAVLAESLGSVASILVAGHETSSAVGVELSASHLHSIRSGIVVGRATPLRLGKSLHVWEIKIHDPSGSTERMICHAKLTVMIRAKESTSG